MQKTYEIIVRFPKVVFLLTLGITFFFAAQLPRLSWETDARVYLPKAHPAILYDEKVDEVFGVKDAVIIGIENEQESIFNADTLARIERITKKIADLPGVIARHRADVASLSTASVFSGTETSIGTRYIMETAPGSEEEIAKLKKDVYDHSDLFVGNIVSEDGTAAIIRARLKEGINNRYMTYFQIKGIIQAEEGKEGGGGEQWWNGQGGESWGGGDQWSQKGKEDTGKKPGGAATDQEDGKSEISEDTGDQWSQKWKEDASKKQSATATDQGDSKPEKPEDTGDQWSKKWEKDAGLKQGKDESKESNDKFYIAGRSVVEVTSGLSAIKDMTVMIPLVMFTMTLLLFLIFRTAAGVLLPLLVMAAGVIWTMGTMALANVPLYTISTMMPVILVAVGIGDGIHMLSGYYDEAARLPGKKGGEIVLAMMKKLSSPLIVASLTTAIGFLALLFAEMPPFRVFGLFTALGVVYCWILSVLFIPSALSVLKPKVGRSHKKEGDSVTPDRQDRLSETLVRFGELLNKKRRIFGSIAAVIVLFAVYGASLLRVDSSWMDDFRKDSEVALSDKMLNEKFDGTISLYVIMEGEKKDALKSPELLKKMEKFQVELEKLPYVGGAVSVVDYLKGIHKGFHAGKEEFDRLPDSRAEIGQYLFLYSVSDRPELLDEVIDSDYRQANITFSIKTDQTRELKLIIDKARSLAEEIFKGTGVTVNLAGAANNSYIWTDLLIRSQILGITLSKVGIFLIAVLIFRSIMAGFFLIIPITAATLLVFGAAGFMDIPLDVSTALAAGIAIGVGIDYTVHFVFRYIHELSRTGTHEEASAATMAGSGKAIVFNAIVVTAGFMVLLFSEFPPHVKLGFFTTAYMAASCLAALTILPVLFAVCKPRFTGMKCSKG